MNNDTAALTDVSQRPVMMIVDDDETLLSVLSTRYDTPVTLK